MIWTVTDIHGNSTNGTQTVTVTAAPLNVSLNTGTISCTGGNTILTAIASGGKSPYKYKLNNGPYQNNNTFSVTRGTYTVTVKDANGLTKISVSKTIPPEITATATAGTITCYGGTTTLTVNACGGSAPLKYSLDGGTFQALNQFTVGAKSYAVAVKDASGCIKTTNTVNITQPTVISVSATAGTILYNGGSTTVTVGATGGKPGYTGTGTFQKSAGTYTFKVTDSKGCTGSKTITITQPALLAASVYSKTNVSCYGGNNGSITVKVTGGTAPYSYKLSSLAYQGSSTFSSLKAGAYSVTVKDKNGYTVTVSNIMITCPSSALTLTVIQKKDVSCYNGSDGLIKVNAGGGTGPYKYSLNGGSFGTGTFPGLCQGTYTVTAKDGNGCTKPITVVIKNGTGNCSGYLPRSVAEAPAPDLPTAKINEATLLTADVFPNPSASEFTLRLSGNSTEPVEIRVVDILGRPVYQTKGSANQSYKFGQRFIAGAYIIEILQGKDVKTIKIIKN